MDLVNIFIRSAFVDNMIFAFFFGMCSYLAVSKTVKTAVGLGFAVIFVLTVTLIFHTDFSNSMQLISFLKNTAIMGGLLIIISNKPQMCSIDYYLESKKGN